MKIKYILSQYVEAIMTKACYDKFEDGSFSGKIPECRGVIAFSHSLTSCQAELRSTLEDWILVGLKLGHKLPIIDGIDLNQEPKNESFESV